MVRTIGFSQIWVQRHDQFCACEESQNVKHCQSLSRYLKPQAERRRSYSQLDTKVAEKEAVGHRNAFIAEFGIKAGANSKEHISLEQVLNTSKDLFGEHSIVRYMSFLRYSEYSRKKIRQIYSWTYEQSNLLYQQFLIVKKKKNIDSHNKIYHNGNQLRFILSNFQGSFVLKLKKVSAVCDSLIHFIFFPKR